MSHKTVFIGIPSGRLGGRFSQEKIASLVDDIMKKYVEETAEDENVKCDWYVIGGRWEGALGALKGTEGVLPADSGSFAYEFSNKYNVVVNNGGNGPYIVENDEYFPVNGGLKKSIAWDAIAKLDECTTYMILKMILARDPRLGDRLPEAYEIRDGDLYIKAEDQNILLLKNGESFSERAVRLGQEFGPAMMPPDAFIDLRGVWHDDNDAWAAFEKKLMSGKLDEMPDNLEEAAKNAFLDDFTRFREEELQGEDCIVVLDCHCFP